MRGVLYVAAGCAVIAVLLYVFPPHSLVGAAVAVAIGILAVIVAYGPLQRLRLTGLAVAAYALASIVVPLSVSWLALTAFGDVERCEVTGLGQRADRDEETGETTYTNVHTVICPDGETVEVEKSREWAEPGSTAEVLRDPAGVLRPDFAEGRTPWGVLLMLAAAGLLVGVVVAATKMVVRRAP